jgi:hypothetical protein
LGNKAHSIVESTPIISEVESGLFGNKKLWTKKNSDVVRVNMQDYSTFL